MIENKTVSSISSPLKPINRKDIDNNKLLKKFIVKLKNNKEIDRIVFFSDGTFKNLFVIMIRLYLFSLFIQL